MAKIKRTAGKHSVRESKAKKKSDRIFLLGVLAVILAAAAGTTLWLAFDNRQTLDGALTSETAYTGEQNIAAVKNTENQRYYSIETHKPVAAAQAFNELYNKNIQTFRMQLDGLLNAKALNRQDPAKLTIGFSLLKFEQYTTYTIHTEQYISARNSQNKIVDYRMIFDGDKPLKAADLFKIGIDYTAKLSVLGGLNASDLDGKLALTNEGLTVFADKTAVIDYAGLYKLMAISLPDKYKPVEPNPIDPKAEKVVALTFDDGPYSSVTKKLLDLLDQYNAKATFFVVGYNTDFYPDTIREIAKRGQSIGIHSTEHRSLTKMTDDEIKADIFGMQDKIEKICGVRPDIVRPVGGNVNQHIADLLGMPIVLWDVDPNDWKYRNCDKVEDYVTHHVQSGDIVLSHDIYESTYEAYEKIIPELAAQGYRFVTVEELIGYTDGAYAGKIIRYRDLCRELRQAGAFEQ